MKNLHIVSLFVLLSLAVSSSGCSSNNDGSDNGSELRNDACDALGLKVIDGTACKTAGTPVVYMEIEFDGASTNICSGTVISEHEVLTAAHCVTSEDTVFTHQVSGIKIRSGEREFSASEFAVHPGYFLGDREPFNDVAVVRFSESLGIRPVTLLASRPVQVGDVFSIFGYGYDENDNLGTLKSGEMAVSEVTNDHIISFFGSSGSNTCGGDSGGPALYTFTSNGQQVTALIGVTSSGDAELNCREGDRSVFANLQNEGIRNFILSYAPTATVL